MKWFKTDLKKELDRKRKLPSSSGPPILQKYLDLLHEDDEQDERILKNLTKPVEEVYYEADFNQEEIYHIDHIKTLCTDYRLRFLSSSLFKAEIPHQAIAKIKRLEKKYGKELRNFYIMAPAPMFNLRHKDKDPLLFLKLDEKHFLFIHKWGTDLSVFRKLLVLPFRNFKTLLITIALFAMSVVMAVPDRIIMGPHDESSLHLRVIFFIYLFIAFSGLSLLYGFSRIKNFNSNLWDSRFLE